MADHDDGAQATSQTTSEHFGMGVLLGAGSLLLFLVWLWYLNIIIIGGDEKVHDACVSAVHGAVVNIDRWSFPTQIWCATKDDRYAGAIYTAWQSVGFSAVSVVFVLLLVFAGRLMLHGDKRAAQARDGRTVRS